jgi:predicted DNA-binding transcriptional regulator YafY
MAKRPDSMETLQIALEMVRRIPKGRTVTGPELQKALAAEGFERDMRTIQRQLEVLSEYFDLERDETTKPYRYSWKELATGFNLPGLTPQESLLLTLAQQQLSSVLPARVMASMQGFFAQANDCLDGVPNAKREREWLKKIRFVSTNQPLIPPTIQPGVFEEVSNALYADQWLDVDYTNAANVTAKRRVMPLGLAQQGPRMYLVCRHEGYDNERSLALHRMRTAKTTGLPFERPPEFDLKQYEDDGRFGYGKGERIQLRFCIRKEAGYHLLESPLSEDQQVVVLADEYEITGTVVDTSMLDWWLRGFGDAVNSVTKRRVKND